MAFTLTVFTCIEHLRTICNTTKNATMKTHGEVRIDSKIIVSCAGIHQIICSCCIVSSRADKLVIQVHTYTSCIPLLYVIHMMVVSNHAFIHSLCQLERHYTLVYGECMQWFMRRNSLIITLLVVSCLHGQLGGWLNCSGEISWKFLIIWH